MTDSRTSRNVARSIFVGVALTLAAPAPAAAFLGFSAGAGAPAIAADQSLPGPVEGEALVRFKPGVDRRQARETVLGLRLSVVNDFPLLSGRKGREYGLVRSSSVGTAELMALLKADPRVDAVMPNFVGRIAAVPSDPLFGELWGLHNIAQEVLGVAGTPDADIDAPEAWDEGAPASGAVVAVIDTGVDYTHEDIAAAAWANPGEVPGNGLDDDGNGWVDDVRGIDTHNRDADPMDDHGHGTHVTGTIAALPDNGVGVAGVAPGARFIAVKTFDEDGRGTVADVIAAIEYVTDLKASRGVEVAAINASFGFYSNQTWFEVSLEDGDILSDAIAAASDAGIMFIAAAGNYGVNNDESRLAHIIYPASYNLPNVIAVGASDANDEPAYFSNWGPKTVDLFAPGVSTLSTIPGGGYDPGTTGTDLFLDRLEGGAADWSHRGLGDTWELSDVESRGPGHGFTAVVPPDGPAIGAVLELERDIDLSRAGAGTVEVAFWAAASLAGPDGLPSSLKVQVSPNGGASWWLTPGTITGSFDWRRFQYTLPLSQLSSRVRVRLVLEGHPDGADWQRVTVDDIGIGIAPSRSYQWASGTSMATPHVTGAVALMAARYPQEGIVARRNRLLTGVDALASFSDRVVTGGRLNLAKAAGFDVPPLVASLDPPGGALPGVRVRVRGVNFGPDPGRVLLEATPRSDYRADRFCFRILKTSDLDDIAHDGVHVDDVRLGTASAVYFEDDMESGDGKWLGVGRPPHGVTWEISDEEAHGGARAWSDSTEATFGVWGRYPSGQYTYLRNLEPVDLTGTGTERITLGFWAMVTTFPQDPVTLWFSRDGGESWSQVAELPNSEGWVHHEFEVAGATPAVEAPVLSWSDTEATIEVPGGRAPSSPGAHGRGHTVGQLRPAHCLVRQDCGRLAIRLRLAAGCDRGQAVSPRHAGGPRRHPRDERRRLRPGDGCLDREARVASRGPALRAGRRGPRREDLPRGRRALRRDHSRGRLRPRARELDARRPAAGRPLVSGGGQARGRALRRRRRHPGRRGDSRRLPPRPWEERVDAGGRHAAAPRGPRRRCRAREDLRLRRARPARATAGGRRGLRPCDRRVDRAAGPPRRREGSCRRGDRRALDLRDGGVSPVLDRAERRDVRLRRSLG